MTLARRCGDNAQNSDGDAMSEKDDMEGNAAEAVKISLDDAHEILLKKKMLLVMEEAKVPATGGKVQRKSRVIGRRSQMQEMGHGTLQATLRRIASKSIRRRRGAQRERTRPRQRVIVFSASVH